MLKIKTRLLTKSPASNLKNTGESKLRRRELLLLGSFQTHRLQRIFRSRARRRRSRAQGAWLHCLRGFCHCPQAVFATKRLDCAQRYLRRWRLGTSPQRCRSVLQERGDAAITQSANSRGAHGQCPSRDAVQDVAQAVCQGDAVPPAVSGAGLWSTRDFLLRQSVASGFLIVETPFPN